MVWYIPYMTIGQGIYTGGLQQKIYLLYSTLYRSVPGYNSGTVYK